MTDTRGGSEMWVQVFGRYDLNCSLSVVRSYLRREEEGRRPL